MYLTGKDIKVYDGNYDYAMEKESIINTKIKEKTLEVKKEENKDNRNTSKLSNNKRTAYEKELKDIELLMDKLESDKEEIAVKMNDPDFFSNEGKVEKVSLRLNLSLIHIFQYICDRQRMNSLYLYICLFLFRQPFGRKDPRN